MYVVSHPSPRNDRSIFILAYLVFRKRNVKFRQSRALPKSKAGPFKRILPFNLPAHDSRVIEVAGFADARFSARHYVSEISQKYFARYSLGDAVND
jgi:hypothetical protein